MRLHAFVSVVALVGLSTGCGETTPAQDLGAGAGGCDATQVKAAIAEKADVNAVEKSSGWTPLMAAAYNGCADSARVLAAAGANPNVKTQDDPAGQTALMLGSTTRGNAETVKVLIAARADLNAQDSDGTSALATAARYGKLEIVKALVAAGADVNARERNGETPLGEALLYEAMSSNPNFGSAKEHADVADFLRQHGGQNLGHP
jgi:ankyrin repeat protein